MKKILLVLMMICGSLLYGQSVQQKQQDYMTDVDEILYSTQIHIDRTGTSYDWRLSNPACSGCGSFYYAITRTEWPDEEGKYYYYLIMQSNSIYGNGILATSYVQDIHVHVVLTNGENVHVLGPFYALVTPMQTGDESGARYVANLWSLEPDIVIIVEWDSVTAY
jgi:hypothetical protein